MSLVPLRPAVVIFNSEFFPRKPHSWHRAKKPLQASSFSSSSIGPMKDKKKENYWDENCEEMSPNERNAPKKRIAESIAWR